MNTRPHRLLGLISTFVPALLNDQEDVNTRLDAAIHEFPSIVPVSLPQPVSFALL